MKMIMFDNRTKNRNRQEFQQLNGNSIFQRVLIAFERISKFCIMYIKHSKTSHYLYNQNLFQMLQVI